MFDWAMRHTMREAMRCDVARPSAHASSPTTSVQLLLVVKRVIATGGEGAFIGVIQCILHV
jgi:hypothetical protein